MPETVREALDREIDLSERLEDFFRDYPDDGRNILDAHIYRSCPECGESRKLMLDALDFESDVEPSVDCPCCKDTTVAIVETALREKAAAANYHCWPRDQPYETLPEPIKDSWRLSVDLTLSTVLGRPVRYAKESDDGDPLIGVIDHFEGVALKVCEVALVDAACTVPKGYRVEDISAGDTMAILEEAGKEE